ncbi:hypothetical protein I302_105985 [Kwoniella bestiolae CBS 10118]|uniref:Uncharacterized protein n=1 Tax=Kwoniella bestiolae CBS 10118 TaxID=1296100 RepID=A0A1B9G2Q4_9TREE|nr:hypothetical protein I302_05109 [Kwoniella bestiolae CBS 10118]OCF25295.1 hypothetical protein I302_05109 [Kwoniella bestiolae CBS 10118]
MPPKVEKETWNDDHTAILIRGIIRHCLHHRSELYQLPGLEGVSDHGGDRINKKVQQILKKVCEIYPNVKAGVVEEEMKLLSNVRSKGKGGNEGGSSPKENGGGGGSVNDTPKKRKVKDESDDE